MYSMKSLTGVGLGVFWCIYKVVQPSALSDFRSFLLPPKKKYIPICSHSSCSLPQLLAPVNLLFVSVD